MTPMDELTRLNRLIRQFQTVCLSTPDAEQRARVEGEIRDLQIYRERIVAETPRGPGSRQGSVEVELADFPVLSRLVGLRQTPAPEGGASTARGCPFQETIRQLALYIRYFGQEYLPILPSAPGSPDVFSRQGDALRAAFRVLEANVTDFLGDCRRMAENGTGAEAEGETRRHHVAHARTIEADAAYFFRSVEKLCDSLSGETPMPGKTLAELEDFTSEAVAFLDIPETSSQENRRADRY